MFLYERRHNLALGHVESEQRDELFAHFQPDAVPNWITIPEGALEVIEYEHSPFLDLLAELQERHGELRLEFSDHKCDVALHLRRIHGVDLARKDLLTKSDPYCEILVMNGEQERLKVRTPIAMDNQDPIWLIEETFVLALHDHVHIDIYDFDRASTDDALGSLDFNPFDGTQGGIPSEYSHQLEGGKGALTLEFAILGLGSP